MEDTTLKEVPEIADEANLGELRDILSQVGLDNEISQDAWLRAVQVNPDLTWDQWMEEISPLIADRVQAGLADVTSDAGKALLYALGKADLTKADFGNYLATAMSELPEYYIQKLAGIGASSSIPSGKFGDALNVLASLMPQDDWNNILQSAYLTATLGAPVLELPGSKLKALGLGANLLSLLTSNQSNPNARQIYVNGHPYLQVSVGGNTVSFAVDPRKSPYAPVVINSQDLANSASKFVGRGVGGILGDAVVGLSRSLRNRMSAADAYNTIESSVNSFNKKLMDMGVDLNDPLAEVGQQIVRYVGSAIRGSGWDSLVPKPPSPASPDTSDGEIPTTNPSSDRRQDGMEVELGLVTDAPPVVHRAWQAATIVDDL